MKRSAGAGAGVASSSDYTEAVGELAKFERMLESGEAEKVLEHAQRLEKYFDGLRQKNPGAYGATDSERKRIAERMIFKFTEMMVAID